MKPSDGKKLENKFVEAVNNKKVGELAAGIKENLNHMYKYLNNNDVVSCELVEGSQKPDFVINIKGEKRYISLKTGTAKAVGTYGLKNFIAYLRKEGVSERTLKTIVLFHFADGTLDNTGRNRYDVETFRKGRENLIEAANRELNGNKRLIKDFVYRVIFKGFYDENVAADYIYFGTQDHGHCCNYRQMCKQIEAKKWKYIRNLHIGPIQFSPVARYVDMNVLDDSKRWGVKFFWTNLEVEIERIGSSFRYQYDGYVTLAEREGKTSEE